MKCWSTRSVTALQDITAAFDRVKCTCGYTSAHSSKSDEHDVSQVASLLLKTQPLQVKPSRKPSCFQKMKTNPLSNLNKAKFLEWLETKKKQTVKFRVVRGEENTSDSDATESDDKDDSNGNDSDKYININEALITGWASQ